MPSIVSRPENVQRLLHIEWDEEKGAFTGVPDVWKTLMPQGYSTVSTESFPQHVAPGIQLKAHPRRGLLRRDGAADAAHSHRASVSPVGREPKISLRQFIKHLGFTDLDKEYNPVQLKDILLFKLHAHATASAANTLVKLPVVMKLHIMQYLDAQSLLRLCSTCTDMHQLVENRLLWKPLVTHKNLEQRTLYSTFSRDWKSTYRAMHRLDHDPKYIDMLLNVVVIGDRRVGKSRLVHSLAASANRSRTHRGVVDDPVIHAVSGIYRLGIDFVTRRVVIDSTVAKLQVWDGNALGQGIPFTSTHVVMIIFDVKNRASFEKLPSILAGALQNLEQSNSGGATILVIGNVTCSEEERVVPYKDAKRFANERGLLYVEANASDFASVDAAFGQVAVELLAAVDARYLKPRDNLFDAAACSIM